MNTSVKSTNAEAEAVEVTSAYATLYLKGLERVVEVSKTSLDVAAEQNTEVLDYCRKALKSYSMPGLLLCDIADEAFKGYVTLQKNLLDFAVEKGATLTEEAREYSHDAGEAVAISEHVIRQSAARAIATQKSVLNIAKKSKSKR